MNVHRLQRDFILTMSGQRSAANRVTDEAVAVCNRKGSGGLSGVFILAPRRRVVLWKAGKTMVESNVALMATSDLSSLQVLRNGTRRRARQPLCSSTVLNAAKRREPCDKLQAQAGTWALARLRRGAPLDPPTPDAWSQQRSRGRRTVHCVRKMQEHCYHVWSRCGAGLEWSEYIGISRAAGIPDFRSQGGLYVGLVVLGHCSAWRYESQFGLLG
ncbi:hypothetical protein K438DRAFT_1932906 [Mycena galopus ATCC 62051]|nr:hypothetical protein K438DRAFT_1932906 [Mycena galopus ATCC 62051]